MQKKKEKGKQGDGVNPGTQAKRSELSTFKIRNVFVPWKSGKTNPTITISAL
jgi:membrane peptidoglycan carboxypeptidase